MHDQPAPAADACVARLAAQQHGAITHAQLVACGLSPNAIARRAASKRLHRLHRGVYAVGYRSVANHLRWQAAVLATGERAALSHRSAAELWELLRPLGSTVHVTLPGRAGRTRRPGIRIHRPRAFDDSLVTTVNGIRVTTVERTIVDLRRSVPESVRRRAIRQADYLGVLGDSMATDRTRSELERTFLRICRRHGIPPPEVNVPIGRFTVDFLWRSQGLVIEVDGYVAHRGRQAFRDDRDRDLELARRGLTVHRIADTRINDDPTGVANLVKDFLTRLGRVGRG